MLRYDMLQNDMLQYEDTMLRYVKIQNIMIMMLWHDDDDDDNES